MGEININNKRRTQKGLREGEREREKTTKYCATIPKTPTAAVLRITRVTNMQVKKNKQEPDQPDHLADKMLKRQLLRLGLT